jgi:hypothetical protein
VSSPQHEIDPPEATAHVWFKPADICVNTLGGGDDCPAESSPQQRTTPSGWRAHEWKPAADTWAKPPEGGEDWP